MIVFGAIVPHPPIIIPAIGKENLEFLKKTNEAFTVLENQIATSKVENILIISPHGIIQENSFTINLSPEYKIDFEDFGDFTTKLKLNGDIATPAILKDSLQLDFPLQLISEPRLDHGCGVPLAKLLSGKNKNLKILPLYYSFLSPEDHYKFGQAIKKVLLRSDKNFGVIASGDLSHRLTKDAPAGYSPKGVKFDQKLVELIRNKKTKEIIEMNPQFIEEAGECGLRSIMILLGIMDGIEYDPEILSYEGPFGVGYLVANLKL